MPSSNKVATSFVQGLSDMEKLQARNNIGALGYITRIDSTGNITVGSSTTGSQGYSIEIPVTDSTRGVFWIVQLCFNIQQSGTTPSVDFLPIGVDFVREYGDGGSNADESTSTSLVRLSQTSPWYGGTHEFRSIGGGNVTKVIYRVEWDSGAIPAGTVISYSIHAYVFG